MDVKFVILLSVALAIVFLLVSEINALKNDMDKKFNEIDLILEKYNEDVKTTLKKETNNGVSKFKTYTNEMLQQIRTMNCIEKQTVVTSDHFIEEDTIESPENFINSQTHPKKRTYIQIPYLSETNPNNYDRKKEVYSKDSNINKYKNDDTKESCLYMSETSEEKDQFKVKDNQNNIINSTKMNSSDKKFKKISTKIDTLAVNNINISEKISVHDETSKIIIDDDDDDDEVIENVNNNEKSDNMYEEDYEDKNCDEENCDEGDEESCDEESCDEESCDEESCDDKVEAIQETVDNNINKKLHNLKKLQVAMTTEDDNDVSSQEITIGSRKKGESINIKSGTIVDDISIGTTCTIDENTIIKLKACSSYTKSELEDLAKKIGINIPAKSNKSILYDAIKASINKK